MMKQFQKVDLQKNSYLSLSKRLTATGSRAGHNILESKGILLVRPS